MGLSSSKALTTTIETTVTTNAPTTTTAATATTRELAWSMMWDLIERCAVEATACMMFHFIGSVAPTPWANGFALMVLVYYTAKISGAHLNPAVTLTFCILGHVTPIEAIAYWGAQVGGCTVGALWIAMLVPGLGVGQPPSGPHAALSGCFTPDPTLSTMQVFAWEAVCSTCFIVPIFSVVWYTQQKKGYGNTGPIIVGASLIANALCCAPFTGASLNPARSVASPIIFECAYRKHVYTYIVGEMLGGAVAVLAIVPWYGISRTAWYGSILAPWAFSVAKNNQQSIVIETLNEDDEKPLARSFRGSRKTMHLTTDASQV